VGNLVQSTAFEVPQCECESDYSSPHPNPNTP